MRSDIHGCLARQGLCVPGDSLCKVAIQAFCLGKNDDDLKTVRELKAKGEKNLSELLSMANCELNRVKANIARQDMELQERLNNLNKETMQKIEADGGVEVVPMRKSAPPQRRDWGRQRTTGRENVGMHNRIKEVRRQRNLTQSALAEKAGVARPFISEIETGTANPTISTALKLARALECSMDYLFLMDEGSA